MKLSTLVLFSLSTVPALAETRIPVLVELFTSEGCSSCPPADKLLADIERKQPIPNAQVLVLSEHVDYWNRLGWRDPFSTRGFSERQSAYADKFKNDGVYTPQMVVDGRAEFVGSDGNKAREAIVAAANEPKAHIEVTSGDKLTVNVDKIPGNADSDVLLAITEANLRIDVRNGENSGRILAHTGVVRRLTVLGRSHDGTFSAQISPQLAADWKRGDLQAVVFVQDRHTKRVLGATSVKL